MRVSKNVSKSSAKNCVTFECQKSLKFERRILCEIRVPKFFTSDAKTCHEFEFQKLFQNRVSKVHQQGGDISGKSVCPNFSKLRELEISYLTGRKWRMYKNISNRFYCESNVEFRKGRLNGASTKHFFKTWDSNSKFTVRLKCIVVR